MQMPNIKAGTDTQLWMLKFHRWFLDTQERNKIFPSTKYELEELMAEYKVHEAIPAELEGRVIGALSR